MDKVSGSKGKQEEEPYKWQSNLRLANVKSKRQLGTSPAAKEESGTQAEVQPREKSFSGTERALSKRRLRKVRIYDGMAQLRKNENETKSLPKLFKLERGRYPFPEPEQRRRANERFFFF